MALMQDFPAKPNFSGTGYHYTVLMEPQNKNWVYALDMVAAYESPLQQNANYLLLTSADTDKRAEYTVISYPDYNTGLISFAEYKKALQLPDNGSEKIRQLISSLNGFESDPEVFITKLLNHFRTENFHYTLTPPLMEENPLETFLFETRKGFCSHYASAFVHLMRVAEIPARVVIGFQGGELNKAGGFLEIRQADAHAWAEVWLKGKGWTRVDPTAAIAPERIEQSINSADLAPGELISFIPEGDNGGAGLNWLKQARQLWSNVDYNWQRWVINYDNKNQAHFLSAFGIQDIKTMIYWLIAISSLIITILAWILLYQKRQAPDKVLQAYNRFIKKFAKHGLTKEISEGPLDFAERCKINFPERSTDIDKLTTVYIDLRYRKNAAPEDLKTFNKRVTKFKI